MSAASDMSRARPLAANDNIASGSWGSGSFTYDPLGNLRSKTLGARTVSLSYDNTKNRVSQSADTGGSGMASTGTRTVDYDLRGNVTTLGDLTFYYDMSNQPTSVTGGVNANYRYDGHMRRARSVVNGKVIYNVYDLSGRLVHVHKDTDDEEIDYIPGPTGTLARIQRDNGNPATDAITYVHNDHLGSASRGTDVGGNIVWTERYTPYGEALLQPSANDDLAGYTGHIRDKELGLNYMQARYQDPVMGRFLSIDPVTFMDTGDPFQFNRYGYGNNNPINMIDPDGEDSFLVFRRTPGDGRHAFVIVTDDNGNVERQYSYGPQNEGQLRNPGQLVAVGDDPTSDTGRDDAAAWQNRDTRRDVRVESLTDMGIADEDTIAAGDAMNEQLGTRDQPGDTPYQVFPRIMRGEGCNSNCGAAGVVEGAQEGASREINPPARTPGWRDPIEVEERE